MRKLGKGLGWVVAVLIPAGLMAAPAAAEAQGFRCGANNPLTQNTRPQADGDGSLRGVDRKTNSSSIDKDRIARAMANDDKLKRGLRRD